MNTLEEQLKSLILSRYKSLREFTLKINMPYTTLDTILKRGVNTANIINILKICNELSISADKLADGFIVEKVPDKNSLSETALQLVENYESLNSLGKNKLIDYSNDLVETPKFIEPENNVVELPVSATEELSSMFTNIAAHDDDLTDDEKAEADKRILAAIKKLKK